jgi:restriction endonuclease Mrr
MNIQLLLLPLIENIDYSIVNNELVAIAKIRTVIQVISHAEVAAIAVQEAHEIIPATFDVSGNELTPMIPAQEAIAGVAFQAAYDEEIEVDETYFENVPSMEQVVAAYIESKLDENDIAILITEYLIGKESLRDLENDSLNIVNNRIHRFSFTNIPQPTSSELVALIPAVQSKNSRKAKLEAIAVLEASLTNRRLREAVLSGDNSFINSVELQINAIRETL